MTPSRPAVELTPLALIGQLGHFGDQTSYSATQVAFQTNVRKATPEVSHVCRAFLDAIASHDSGSITTAFTQLLDHFFAIICTPQFSQVLTHLHELNLSELSQKDRYGRSILHLAILGRCPSLWKKLIENRYFIDAATPEGLTPLAIASITGNQEAAGHLLEHGANPLQEDQYQRISLHWAVANNKTNVMQALLSHTSATKQLEQVDSFGWNARAIAGYYGHHQMTPLMDQIYIGRSR